ncbi:MAG: Myxococcus phage Mx8 [Pseudomonadota bacterium]
MEAKIQSSADFSDTPAGLAALWNTEIEAAGKELKKFHDDADKITTRYLDKRDNWGAAESRVNLFWSSMKVLLSLLYARPPRASVSRAFLDAEDDQARVASTIMQRLLNRSFDDAVSSWDAAVRQGIEDWLVVGMGQLWLRYEVETEIIPASVDPVSGVEIPEAEQIVEEDACADYVYWKDFFWSPARTWKEVRWVARRVYMTKDQLEARFGEEIARVVPLTRTNAVQDNDQTPRHDPWSRAEVFEIWCKDKKKAYWYAKGAPTILDVKDDPLGLEGFFPCPKPLAANLTSSNFMPRADYIFAQDQFNELDEINTRITWLTRAARVAGVYDKAAGDSVGRMFEQAQENRLIPVDNWAMFAEAGGVKGKIDFAPIEQVVNCIERLRTYRADKTSQIYEVLGISDVMRGSSVASETATAQQIKAQFGSTRIQLMQFYIAEWITEALRIKAEIIAQHWQPQTILARSNILRTPDAQFAGPAIELLKNEELSEYRIVVEADSMAALDWSAERDAAVQFMQGLGAFVSQVAPFAEKTPGAGPFLMKLLQWSVSKFRVSTEIESVLDQAIAGMQQQLQQPPEPPPPDPRVQVEMAKIQSNERIAMMEAQSDKEIATLKATIDLQKVEMQAKFDQVSQQYQALQQLLTMQPPAPAAPAPVAAPAPAPVFPEMPAMPDLPPPELMPPGAVPQLPEFVRPA